MTQLEARRSRERPFQLTLAARLEVLVEGLKVTTLHQWQRLFRLTTLCQRRQNSCQNFHKQSMCQWRKMRSQSGMPKKSSIQQSMTMPAWELKLLHQPSRHQTTTWGLLGRTRRTLIPTVMLAEMSRLAREHASSML